jgi:asparagine synthase (glutamine-hydrolysing)
MSMAWSVESRVPFLDHRLVEFVFSLDDDDKLREGKTKYILRKSLQGIVPDIVLTRREKQSFSGGEICMWLRGPLRHLTDLPLKLEGLDVPDSRRAANVLQEFKSGNNQAARVAWNIVNLNYWLHRQ